MNRINNYWLLEDCYKYEEKTKKYKSYERMLEIGFLRALVQRNELTMKKECLDKILEKKITMY